MEQLRQFLSLLILFFLMSLGGWLAPPCADYSNDYYNYDTPIRPPDSLAMRAILDANNLGSLHVDSVCVGAGGYVSEIKLSRMNLDSFHFPDTVNSLSYYLTSLRRLDLSRNRLTEVPRNVWLLGTLQELVLDSNLITSLPDTMLTRNINGLAARLAVLSLSYNRLDSIPPRIQNLQALWAIRLISNPLRNLPLEIGDLPYLRDNKSRVSYSNGLDVTYDRICGPAPELAALLDKYAKLDWRITQICPPAGP